MAWSVRVEGARQLVELQARIKEAGDTGMTRKFRRHARAAGKPAVTALRAAAAAVKVASSKQGKGRPKRSTGLRARAASAVGISLARKGIRIVVSATKFGAYGVTLPRYLDAELTRFKRWRYPVFWSDLSSAPPTRVKQQTGQPWFFTTIRDHEDTFRKAVVDVMDETERELSK